MGLMVSEKKIFCFSCYKSGGANDPRDVANLDPRGMVSRINVGDHLTPLHNLLALGLMVSEKKIFMVHLAKKLYISI